MGADDAIYAFASGYLAGSDDAVAAGMGAALRLGAGAIVFLREVAAHQNAISVDALAGQMRAMLRDPRNGNLPLATIAKHAAAQLAGTLPRPLNASLEGERIIAGSVKPTPDATLEAAAKAWEICGPMRYLPTFATDLRPPE